MSLIDVYRRRDPGIPLPRVMAYHICWYGIRSFFTALYGMRVQGQEHIPKTGGVLVVANHQTNFDPPLMAVGSWRHFHFVAKGPLFENPKFAWLIRTFNAIPIEQNKPDTAAIKTTIEHLRAGRMVLIYPEGSRTHDGAINPFKAGTSLLIRRAKVPVLPMAIEGAFDLWPRWQSKPKWSGYIRIKFGPVVPYEELAAAGTRGMLDLLKGRIDDMRLDLRRQIRAASHGTWPPTGPGDYAWDDPILESIREPDPDPA